LNPKQFLQIGGAILLVLGIVGYAGVFSDPKSAFYLTGGENLAHTVLGVVALAASMWLSDAMAKKWLVALVGVIALFFGVYTLAVGGNPVPNTFGVANLESPADLVLHVVVGLWALYAAFMGKDMETSKA
jgi:di/tricarboxylate transporter